MSCVFRRISQQMALFNFFDKHTDGHSIKNPRGFLIKKQHKMSFFELNTAFQAQPFLGEVSIPIYNTIMQKTQNRGRTSLEIWYYSFKGRKLSVFFCFTDIKHKQYYGILCHVNFVIFTEMCQHRCAIVIQIVKFKNVKLLIFSAYEIVRKCKNQRFDNIHVGQVSMPIQCESK